MNEKIKTIAQILLLVWFFAISGFIFYVGFNLFTSVDSDSATKMQTPPTPPELPKELAEVLTLKPPAGDLKKEQVDAYEKQISAYTPMVNAYTQRVTAYGKQVDAYGKQLDQQAKINRIEAYKAVVNDTLVKLLSSFVTALIAYIFAKVGADAVYNYVNMKNGVAPERTSIF